ncbi:MAG: hypothetical protein NXI09_01290 [Bacteroidetes bacterium]|nr:hypothetical protein [Bacteroidota bacterium]
MSLISPPFNQGLGGYVREFVTVMRRVFLYTGKPQSKFVLFGRGRSGSTLLTQMLNESPDISCDKEIFNRPVLFPRLFLRSRKSRTNRNIYGFKLLSYQLREMYSPSQAREFLRYLSEKQGYKIVYLTRENPVLQTLSKHYARHRGSWHQTNEAKPEKMRINVPSFIQELRASIELDEFEQFCLKGLNNFKVVYEQDLKEPKEHWRLMDRLTHYLGVSIVKPNSDLKRISTDKVADYVENWTELKECLSYSEFARFTDFE